MAASEQRKVDALQFIFSLFLGILLVVVVGVGVWTFYPDPYGPNSPEQEQLEELYKEQEQLSMKTGGVKAPSPAEQAEQKRIQDEIDAINDSMTEGRNAWAVNTSIILLTFATILMAVSLFLPESMRVFANGVLLGGLFTMIYGTGWSFAGGDSRARFWVVLVALLLSLLFGYLRFIRGRHEDATAVPAGGVGVGGAAVGAPSGASMGAADAADLTALAARVDALEARAAAAAAALTGEDRD